MIVTKSQNMVSIPKDREPFGKRASVGKIMKYYIYDDFGTVIC